MPHWATKRAFEAPKQKDSGYRGRIAPKSAGDGLHPQAPSSKPPLKNPWREDKPRNPSWEVKKKVEGKWSATTTPSVGKIVFWAHESGCLVSYAMAHSMAHAFSRSGLCRRIRSPTRALLHCPFHPLLHLLTFALLSLARSRSLFPP